MTDMYLSNSKQAQAIKYPYCMTSRDSYRKYCIIVGKDEKIQ